MIRVGFSHQNFSQALEILQRAQEIFPIYFDFLEEMGKLDSDYKNRTGCYLTVVSRSDGIILLTGVVGIPPTSKVEKYYGYSIEKAMRLLSHDEHLTSHESRDEKEKWGGSIKSDTLIISTSGFPQRADSLFSVVSGKEDIITADVNYILELAEAEMLAKKLFKKYGTIFI